MCEGSDLVVLMLVSVVVVGSSVGVAEKISIFVHPCVLPIYYD